MKVLAQELTIKTLVCLHWNWLLSSLLGDPFDLGTTISNQLKRANGFKTAYKAQDSSIPLKAVSVWLQSSLHFSSPRRSRGTWQWRQLSLVYPPLPLSVLLLLFQPSWAHENDVPVLDQMQLSSTKGWNVRSQRPPCPKQITTKTKQTNQTKNQPRCLFNTSKQTLASSPSSTQYLWLLPAFLTPPLTLNLSFPRSRLSFPQVLFPI